MAKTRTNPLQITNRHQKLLKFSENHKLRKSQFCRKYTASQKSSTSNSWW